MEAQGTLGNLKNRSVVSCFIFTPTADSDHPRVALFRRSKHTTTYQHRLAPISGSINKNESPSQAAWRELEEETTLTSQELQLWRQGQPYMFDDISVGRRWKIHPFAFLLQPNKEEKIKIDWEHEGWGWYEPHEVSEDDSFNGVPRLTESLRRVWFERDMGLSASAALCSGLEQLKTDHQSGSHELTSIAVKAFRDVLIHLRSDPDWWKTALTAAWHLWKNGRESMGAATLNAFVAILADIEAILPLSLDNETSWDRVLAVVDHHLEERQKVPLSIKNAFAKYLAETFLSTAKAQSSDTLTVLTLSASSTIRDSIIDAFSSLPLAILDLRILESRPLFEGASMASSLLCSFESKHPAASGRHLRLTVYTDASAAIAAADLDFVLLGADRISSSGCVSNKTGSLPAVLSAKYVSPDVQVIVLSGLDKVSCAVSESDPDFESCEDQPEDNGSTEVTLPWVGSGVRGVNLLQEGIEGSPPKTANCQVKVKNIYFEWVPAEMIDGYVCERGLCSVVDIQKKALDVTDKASRYFGLI